MLLRLCSLVLLGEALHAPPLPQGNGGNGTRHIVMSPEAASVWGEAAAVVEERYPVSKSSINAWPLWRVVGRHRRGHHEKHQSHWQLEEFFASTVGGQWILFTSFWLVLMRLSWFIHRLQLVSTWSHAAALGIWAMAAMLYLGWQYFSSGEEAADKWLDGYVIELVLSMENIFLYQMVLAAFKVPQTMARFALLVVSLFQMVFQMFLFMGIAAYIQDLQVLPYLLGAWLIVVGVQTLRDDDEEGFDAAQSEVFKTCRLALGDRLLGRYDEEGRIFVYQNGRLAVTMMGPVILCLLAIMLAMEVDVTLAKIEEIDNHFIAWSSSVLAAFALPELFVVVCELLRRFYLLKPAISFLVLFFGVLLLFRDAVVLSDTVELSVMLAIVVSSIFLSSLLHLDPRQGSVYAEEDEPKKQLDEEAIVEVSLDKEGSIAGEDEGKR